MINPSIKGYLAVIAASIMWASSGAISKSLFNEGMTPYDLVQIRVTFASLVFGAYLLVFHRPLLKISKSDLKWMFIHGALVMALVQISYFYTISKLQLMTALLLQYLSPIIVAIFAVSFWGERMTLLKFLAIVLAFSGCFLALGGYNLNNLRLNVEGITGGLIAALSYSVYCLLGEKLMYRYSPWTVVFYALFFASFTWHVVHPPFKYLHASYMTHHIFALSFIILVGTIGAFSLFFWGINYIRSTRAMITATLEPVSAGVIAWIFLGEKLEPIQILGAVLSVCAIVLLQIGMEQDHLAPQALRCAENT
ncbi:MAG: DMT family transporter [Desulfomonilaceae bacterium]